MGTPLVLTKEAILCREPFIHLKKPELAGDELGVAWHGGTTSLLSQVTLQRAGRRGKSR